MSSVTETGIPLYLEFPFHRQDYSDTCGAACVQMILDHHGIYLPPSPFTPPNPAEPPNQLVEQSDLVNAGESQDPDSILWVVSPNELVEILEKYGVAGYEALGWDETPTTSTINDIDSFAEACKDAVDDKRLGESFAVNGRGASRLLAPCRNDPCASKQLAPHRITSSPALIFGASYCPPMIVVDSIGHWIVLTSCVIDATGGILGFYYHDPLLYSSGTPIPSLHFSGDLCSFNGLNGNAYITFEGLSERTKDRKIIVRWADGNGAMAMRIAADGNGAMAMRIAADGNGATARRIVAGGNGATAKGIAEAHDNSRIEPLNERKILVLCLIKSIFKWVYRIVARVARAVYSILFSDWTKPQTGRLDKCEEEIAAKALSAIETHGLKTRKGWDQLLAGTSIGPPLRVGQEQQSYYLAPAQNQTGETKMLVLMDAVTGAYWGSLIVTSGHFLFRDDPKARDLVNEVIVALRSKLKQDGIRDTSYWEKEFVKQVNSTRPNLMWTPCRESESLFFPFYAIQPGATSKAVYVRVDGEVFISLTPDERMRGAEKNSALA